MAYVHEMLACLARLDSVAETILSSGAPHQRPLGEDLVFLSKHFREEIRSSDVIEDLLADFVRVETINKELKAEAERVDMVTRGTIAQLEDALKEKGGQFRRADDEVRRLEEACAKQLAMTGTLAEQLADRDKQIELLRGQLNKALDEVDWLTKRATQLAPSNGVRVAGMQLGGAQPSGYTQGGEAAYTVADADKNFTIDPSRELGVEEGKIVTKKPS